MDSPPGHITPQLKRGTVPKPPPHAALPLRARSSTGSLAKQESHLTSAQQVTPSSLMASPREAVAVGSQLLKAASAMTFTFLHLSAFEVHK